MRVVSLADATVGQWKNGAGAAAGLLTLPEGAVADDAIWQLNIAWFDTDVPFSVYPGLDRQLLVLQGTFTIDIDGVSTRLAPDDQAFTFPGGATTRVRDVAQQVRVFNVLGRSGQPMPWVGASTGHAFLGRDPNYTGLEAVHVVAGAAVARRLVDGQREERVLTEGETLIGDGGPIDIGVEPGGRIAVVAAERDRVGWRPAVGPRVIAHRGASGYAPENTWSAFERAIAMGAHAIETDVRLSADGVPVLVHDATVDRTSDGTGAVAEQTYAELRSLDIGAWMGPEWVGERVVTLDELIAVIGRRIPLVIEIKDPAAVGPTMARLRDARTRWEVTSFDWDAVVAARAELPGGRYGFLARAFNRELIDRCVAAGLDQICPPAATLTTDLVRAARDAGLVVRAHGVKRRTDVVRLFDTGVDGATVNWPDWMLEPAGERTGADQAAAGNRS